MLFCCCHATLATPWPPFPCNAWSIEHQIYFWRWCCSPLWCKHFTLLICIGHWILTSLLLAMQHLRRCSNDQTIFVLQQSCIDVAKPGDLLSRWCCMILIMKCSSCADASYDGKNKIVHQCFQSSTVFHKVHFELHELQRRNNPMPKPTMLSKLAPRPVRWIKWHSTQIGWCFFWIAGEQGSCDQHISKALCLFVSDGCKQLKSINGFIDALPEKSSMPFPRSFLVMNNPEHSWCFFFSACNKLFNVSLYVFLTRFC